MNTEIKMMIKLMVLAAVLLLPGWILADSYNIDREKDSRIGSKRFVKDISFEDNQIQTTYEYRFNNESTLIRERIFLNDPICPVKIRSHKIESDGALDPANIRFSGMTIIEVKNPIVAIDVRTSLYDVFGQHMTNLQNLIIKDFSPGQSEISGLWSANIRQINEFMTAVTWVARVRLADGTQWVYHEDKLISALSTLNLEQKFVNDGED